MRIKSRSALFFAVCLAVFAFFPVAGFAASTASLTVGSDSGNVYQTLSIPITVDNPATIAGAAFTIQYSSSLSVTVDSTFFDTFYNQLDDPNLTKMGDPVDLDNGSYQFPVLDDNGDPVTDDNGDPVYVTIPPVVDSIPYDQPLITNTETEDDGTTVNHHISAARIMPADADENGATLFTLNVSLNKGAPSGTYDITIIPTHIINADAGYPSPGSDIDLLVGSDLNKPITDPAAFPVVLDDADYATHVTAGQVVFAVDNTDSDHDGLPDSWERQYFEDLSTSDGTADSDHDGYTDLQEYANDTDPTDGTTAAGSDGYSACTDARVADSLQSVTLSTSGSSAPGGTLVVSATYDVSDGANTAGIDISVFFDSSKVTYAGYNADTFLNEGDIIKTPDDIPVSDDLADTDNNPDTDKMIQMSWTSTTSAWPDISLPALLADLNFTVNANLSEGDELPFSVLHIGDPPAGYSFCDQSMTATVNIWNLDVDGDGTVGKYTDGLLVMRYLLGFKAAPGWTTGYINTGATRDEAAISAFIKSGVDQLNLDIDGDGTVGKYTDGLLVMRYLLGFKAAPGWTVGYINTGATRDEAAIEAYIGSLIK